MVQLEDSEELLSCYSDPVSAQFFNSDNCTNNFVFRSLDEMKKCIQFWIHEYENLDLVSTYEKESQISDILSMVDNHFYDCLEVATVITKAIPAAKQRVIALKSIGYHQLKSNPIMPFEHYYVKAR